MIPAPILNIETTHFYVHGLEAGAYLFKNEQHRVMLGISYMPLEFDASDSDDNRMKQLDDRDASVHGITKMERPFSLNGTLLFEYGTIRHPEVLLKRNDHRTKSEHRSLKTERA